MIKNILLILIISFQLFGVELSNINSAEISKDMNSSIAYNSKRVFGYNLFNGSFAKNRHYRYNPNYLINIGDTIILKMWGSFNFETKVSVDLQGNIFIPRVGNVKVLGIRNDKLTDIISKSVNKVFKKSVYVYANLDGYQPVNIFVTGAVNKPGLYEGLSSDSIIQFIDKAKGINNEIGSYRKIAVLRENKKIYEVDLYNFLLNGYIKPFQFHNGDVIMVQNIKYYIEIQGDVKQPYRFELISKSIDLNEVLQAVIPNYTVTNFTITKFNKNNTKTVKIYSIKDNLNIKIENGDIINFINDHNSKDIKIEIAGEHSNIHYLVEKKGVSLAEVIKQIKTTNLSDLKSFQLYRKSVAEKQKALLNSQLDDLEAKTLTTTSITESGAAIRNKESQLVMNFIKRARKIEFKGRIVINKDSNLSKIFLEDGDTIFIPRKSRMVVVQGEVMLPTAQTYVKGLKFKDYIDNCGGFTDRANTDQILIVKRNGKVISYQDSIFNNEYQVEPGDSILVLGKVETKYLQAVKDITQILYQIAVGAAVVLKF